MLEYLKEPKLKLENRENVKKLESMAKTVVKDGVSF